MNARAVIVNSIAIGFFGSLVPAVAHADCFDDAGSRYGIEPLLLRAIAKVESSCNPAATNWSHVARTKGHDIGLMQVNSSWLPRLAAFGIDEQKLGNGCQNVYVGAWVLAQHFAEAGADWNGVGAYNASCRTLTKQQCEQARNTYAWKVYRAMQGQPCSTRQSALPASRGAQHTTRASEAQVHRVIRTVRAGDHAADRADPVVPTASLPHQLQALAYGGTSRVDRHETTSD